MARSPSVAPHRSSSTPIIPVRRAGPSAAGSFVPPPPLLAMQAVSSFVPPPPVFSGVCMPVEPVIVAAPAVRRTQLPPRNQSPPPRAAVVAFPRAAVTTAYPLAYCARDDAHGRMSLQSRAPSFSSVMSSGSQQQVGSSGCVSPQPVLSDSGRRSYQPPPLPSPVASVPNLAKTFPPTTSRCRSFTPHPDTRHVQPATVVPSLSHPVVPATRSWVPPLASSGVPCVPPPDRCPSPMPPAPPLALTPIGTPVTSPSENGMPTFALTAGGSNSTGSGPPGTRTAAAVTAAAGDGNPERYSRGTEVVIGKYRFRCSSVLGRGSFSEVWSGSIVSGPGNHSEEVALKDVVCTSQTDFDQALLEVSLLERFQHQAAAAPGLAAQAAKGVADGAPFMRIPQYLTHKIDRRQDGWRVRVAMTRVPGEGLDAFLRKPSPSGRDASTCVRRGCALAAQLVRQLGPTLGRVAPHAWHRDVNSRNILISDAVTGGLLQQSVAPSEIGSRASFWLIDFGLAVDATTWQQNWPHADVAGDCRYWPPSSFLMSFYGPEETAAHADLCKQYRTRLDIAGLGITALEVLCNSLLACDEYRGSWRKLLAAWQKYREEVTRWHTMIFQVFSKGGDIGPLYQQLSKERVVDKVAAHISKVRTLLRACAVRTDDASCQSLLQVLAELIDERSSIGMQEAVDALVCDSSSQVTHAELIHTAASYGSPAMAVPSAPSPAVPVVGSYVPPTGPLSPMVQSTYVPSSGSLVAPARVQAASYVPPAGAIVQSIAQTSCGITSNVQPVVNSYIPPISATSSLVVCPMSYAPPAATVQNAQVVNSYAPPLMTMAVAQPQATGSYVGPSGILAPVQRVASYTPPPGAVAPSRSSNNSYVPPTVASTPIQHVAVASYLPQYAAAAPVLQPTGSFAPPVAVSPAARHVPGTFTPPQTYPMAMYAGLDDPSGPRFNRSLAVAVPNGYSQPTSQAKLQDLAINKATAHAARMRSRLGGA